jgi:DNA polymerase III epsilon subunit-like protein
MIFIDIEATGTEPHIHSILSIGAIDGRFPSRQFYGECQRFEGSHVMDDALKVNGFTLEQINDSSKQTEAELITAFLTWSHECEDRTLAGQNVSFDRAYVAAACARAGVVCDVPYRVLDTHTMCYMHMIKRGEVTPFDEVHHRTNISLTTVLHYCGIPQEPTPHNALMGAKCHAEVGVRLLFGKGLLPDFSQYPLPW